MFCKNCGKDIGEAKFCQYCGSSNDINNNITINIVQSDFIKTVKDKIVQIGQEKLIKLIAIISTIINIIIRVINNEIEVVYTLVLGQDDYFVVSDSGRIYMLIIIAIQIIASVLLYNNAKKNQTMVSKKAIVLSVILIVVQILAMLLRLPAA